MRTTSRSASARADAAHEHRLRGSDEIGDLDGRALDLRPSCGERTSRPRTTAPTSTDRRRARASSPSRSSPRRSSPRCWPWSTFGQKRRSISPRALTVARSEPLPRIAAGRNAYRRPVPSSAVVTSGCDRHERSLTVTTGDVGHRAVARANDRDERDRLPAPVVARIDEDAVRRAVVRADSRPLPPGRA